MCDEQTNKLLQCVVSCSETGDFMSPQRLAQKCHESGADVELHSNSVVIRNLKLGGDVVPMVSFERSPQHDKELEQAWAAIYLDVRTEVPTLTNMLRIPPVAGAQLTTFAQELQHLRSEGMQ